MPATPPNKKPFVRRTINRTRSALTGMAPVQRRTSKSTVGEKFNAEAYKFDPKILDEKYAYTFTCSGCSSLPPYTIMAPISIFVQAIVNKPTQYDQAKIAARDRLRAHITSQHYVDKFSSDHVRTIGDSLTKLGKLPFNPFRPQNDKLRSKHQGLLDIYAADYNKYIREGSSVPQVKAAPKTEDNSHIVSVKGSAGLAKVVVKNQAQPEAKKVDPALKKLSVRQTVEAVEGDKAMALKYLELEAAQDKPRSSLVRRLKQIAGAK